MARRPYLRPPVVAGSQGFYPSRPANLTKLIEDYLEQAETLKPQAPFGLIAPHAGYAYSGPVAGWAYRQIMGHAYSTVVVIAPSHTEAFPYISIMPDGAYETPLGQIEVDVKLAERISRRAPSLLQLSDTGHLSRGWGTSEHSLEVQLPFLQHVLGSFKLVPIIMGTGGWQASRALGEALAKVCKKPDQLIVASSDLSHYHPYEEAIRRDQKMIEAIAAGDAVTIAEGCQSGALEACGGAPIASLLVAAEKLGRSDIEILRHANSGDVPGGLKNQVVGYLAAAIYPESEGLEDQK